MRILPTQALASRPGGACTFARAGLAAAFLILAAAVHAHTLAPRNQGFEGAIGTVVAYGPHYLGAAESGASAVPAFYLRYKRLSVSNRAGFVSNRRPDDVLRGLGLDLLEDEDWDASLGLRVDRGRSEDRNEAFRGLGDVPATLRVRLGVTRLLDDGWRASASWTVDAFDRGGGHLGDVAVVREWPLSPSVTATASSTLTLAGTRYLQTYFGIDAAQAGRSGYPVYLPRRGLRDLNATLGWRFQLGPHWAAMTGISVTRMLGPAADSPLVQRRTGWSTSAGLAWRF